MKKKLSCLLIATASVLIGAGCATVPPHEITWEYKILQSHRNTEEELNRLASEGWIVDSAQIREASTNYTFILKRRR